MNILYGAANRLKNNLIPSSLIQLCCFIIAAAISVAS